MDNTIIPGVKIKELTTHEDERGFFREVIRRDNAFFAEGFGQWSHSVKKEGYYTQEFHIHQYQVDWWYVPMGLIKVVLCDQRENYEPWWFEVTMNDLTGVLRIPPGVAHGFKVLSGPAHLMYITSKVYNPADEGRIELDYQWND